MEEQSSEGNIEKLLEELQSDSAVQRELAANKIAEEKVADDRIVEALTGLASSDSSESVAQAAAIALIQLGMNPPEGTGVVGGPSKPKPPLTTKEKRRDFLFGFFGWWVANIAVWALLGGAESGMYLANLLIFPINILFLIVFAFVRRWIALGILATYAVNFVIAMILQMSTNAVCWIPFVNR